MHLPMIIQAITLDFPHYYIKLLSLLPLLTFTIIPGYSHYNPGLPSLPPRVTSLLPQITSLLPSLFCRATVATIPGYLTITPGYPHFYHWLQYYVRILSLLPRVALAITPGYLFCYPELPSLLPRATLAITSGYPHYYPELPQ